MKAELKGEIFMYKTKIIVLTLVTTLLAGCSSGMQTQQPAPTEPMLDLPYEIIRENGEWYLLLEDDIKQDDDIEGSFSSNVGTIEFGSMQEMEQDIKTGNFTDDELIILSNFPELEDGRIGICNLSRLYDAYTPETVDKKVIIWHGYCYRFELRDNSFYCSMQGEISNEEKEKSISNIIGGSGVQGYTMLSTEQTEDRNATVITYTSISIGETNEHKLVYYTLEADGKNVFVAEKYASSIDTIPYFIQMLGTEDGINYSVNLLDVQERPSVEYLMGFGFREYVETEVA